MENKYKDIQNISNNSLFNQDINLDKENIVEVNIKDLRLHAHDRFKKNAKKILEIKNSIREVGLLTPLIVIQDDIKNKLINKGVPEKEIAFIHDANNEKQKDTLFSKVRKGEVRILLGSTQKMGAGTNVQDKLIALHDLDVLWRPSDLEHTQVVNYKNITNRLSQ